MKLKKVLLFLFVSQLFLLNIVKAEVTDIGGHWAEIVIRQWMEKGYVQGNDKGKFNPDEKITRAEMVALVNKIAFNDIQVPEEYAVSFTDVPDFEWYYDLVIKAKYCGYINGYPDGTFKPNTPLTREQAVSIAGAIYDIKTNGETEYEYLNQFSDSALANEFARGYLNEFIKLGYINGYEKNELKPSLQMTRAEAVVLFNKLLDLEVKLLPNGGEARENTPATQAIIEQSLPEISFEYHTEQIRTVLTVNVNIQHNREIKEIKWLRGMWNSAEVKARGADITQEKYFDILENDIYTVYVEDIFENSNIRLLPITNIDSEILNVKMDYDLSPTTESILMKLIPKENQDIKTLKWQSGEHKIELFATAGIDITDTKQFLIEENGVYTIYVEDKNENKEIRVITINSIYEEVPIDTEAPYICYKDMTNKYIKIEELTNCEIEGIYIVDDISKVKNVKLYLWDEEEYLEFQSNEEGIVYIPIEQFETNQTYKIIMEDNVGFVAEAKINFNEENV